MTMLAFVAMIKTKNTEWGNNIFETYYEIVIELS